jgi:hypothetical protein
VIRQLLSPLFERPFHDHSYGFRPKRNYHQAIEKIREIHRQGFTHVLDADIAAFFDHFSHAAILTELALVVADGNILELVRRFLCAGVMESGEYQTTRIGTPRRSDFPHAQPRKDTDHQIQGRLRLPRISDRCLDDPHERQVRGEIQSQSANDYYRVSQS